MYNRIALAVTRHRYHAINQKLYAGRRFDVIRPTTEPAETPRPVTRPRGTSERWNDARAIPKERIKKLHEQDQDSTGKLLLGTALLIAASLGGLWAFYAAQYVLMIGMWIIGGVLTHIKPLAFHDAAHGTLNRHPRLNEWFGQSIATAIIVPLSLYRYAHAKHHSHIATEKDPELWPFTQTHCSRTFRRTVAIVEVVFGFIATPILFFRCFITADDIPSNMRRKIWIEYAVSAGVWSAIVSVAWLTGNMPAFFVAIVAPWMVAGMLQTLNKYVEHMGMMGVGVMASSRSVIPDNQVGEAFSAAWQNVAHHGTHHLYAKIPHYKLPEASEHVISLDPPPGTIFPSYRAAFWAMLKTLHDPKVGPQWLSV